MALKVAEVVARVAPDGNWRQKLDDVCETLDEAVSIPKVWRTKDKCCRTWSDQLDRGLKVKAIEYRLRSANVLKKTTPGTFS